MPQEWHRGCTNRAPASKTLVKVALKMRTFRTGALCSLSLAVSLSMALPASSQERVGIVTAVIGPVTVARTSTAPAPLSFKDPVYLRDRVTTGDNATTRILLGGKVIVTARERSTLTITEVPGVSTIDLTSGRIAVAVDKTRMKPGERVDVRTPNAIAGVRGTVLIVEADGNTSTVTVLRGLVDVTRVDPRTGQAVGAVTPVGAHQTVSVRGTVLPPQAQAITSRRAGELSKEFTPPVRPVPAGAVMPVQDEVDRATDLLNALLPPDTPTTDRLTASGSTNPSEAPGVATTLSATAPVVTSAVPTATSTLTTAVPTVTSTLTTVVPTVTSTLTPVITPVLAPTTTLVPTVPTTSLTPPPPSSSGGLLGGLLKPVTGLLR